MKIRSWLRVEALINARAHLIELKDAGRIEISIGGEYQNRDFVSHVEHAVRLELRNRIIEIERDLKKLGVELD